MKSFQKLIPSRIAPRVGAPLLALTASGTLPMVSSCAAPNVAPATALAPRVAPARDAGKPNILVIVADDLGYGDIGVHGCKDIPTPNIDSLARNGVRFSNGYVSAPQCAPTRAGLLTGRYQQRFGFEFNPIRSVPGAGLPLGEVTLANRLKAAGYVTGMVGKWHLGSLPQQHPQSRGFDEYFGFLGGANPYLPPAQAQALGQTPRGLKKRRAPAPSGARLQNDDEQPVTGGRRQSPDAVPNILRSRQRVAEKQYLTDAFGREARSFIERRRQQPFFLYLAFNAPHGPLQATPQYLQRFSKIANPTRRTYAAMVSAMDDAIGSVLNKLRATGLERNTLIFFVSDNGGPLFDGKWNGSSNAPLSGEKGDVLEGGIRVPFLAQWKGRLPAGRVYDKPVIQLDILPTALSAARAQEHARSNVDGVDLLPYLSGARTGTPHQTLYWRFNRGRTPEMYQWAIQQGDLKLFQPRQESRPTLVNLAKDLQEKRDLSAQQPVKAAALEALWRRWNAQLAEPAWQMGGGSGDRNPQRARRRNLKRRQRREERRNGRRPRNRRAPEITAPETVDADG